MVLSGVNTYAGNTELNNGTLEITNSGALGTGSIVHVTGASTLQLDNPMTLTKNFDLAAKLTVNITSPNDSTLSGKITGAGSLKKTGSATLILTGTNTYSGGTEIDAGTLQGNTNAIQGNILDNASLVFDQNIASGTFSGNISGPGSVTVQNTGTVIFTGINSYSGGTTIVPGATLQGNTTSLQGAILDNGTLIFDQSFPGTFNGVITGSGTIVKQNIGDLKFNTDQSAFAGQTNVNRGKLILANNLGGNVDVYNSATIEGFGAVGGNLHMHSGSTISPSDAFGVGIATFNVLGNYTQDTGSLYSCTVDTTGNSDLINAGGTAQIHGDLFIDFRGPFVYGVHEAHIVHADGGRVGVFVNVTTNTSALVTPVPIYTANDVYLSWITDLIGVALTPNQANVSIQIDGITNPTPDELLIINQLVNLSPQDARHALDSLAGEQYTYITQMNRYSNERLNKRIFTNIQEMTHPCWCPCECDILQPWFVVEKGAPSALGDKNAASMHSDVLDMTLGANVPFNKTFVMGGAVNYEKNEAHFHRGGKANWNIWQGSVYALLQQPIGYLFINGIAGSGFGDFKRKIQFGLIDRVALGKPKTHQGYLYTEVGMNFAYCHVLMQPYFAGEFAYYKEKAFSETGANSVDLAIEAKTTRTVDSYLGTHMTTMIGSTVTLSADLAWHHCYGYERFNTENSFIAFGSPFPIKGSKIGEDAAEGSLAISALFCDKFNLYAEVSGERWYGWGAYSFDLGVNVWW